MSRTTRIAAGLLAAATVGAATPSHAPELAGRVYRLDGAHSNVEFSVRYLRLMEVKGRFRDWDAAILNPDDPERGAIAVVFKTASLDTGNETRDEHLKSPDFFDAEAHPTVVFVSQRVERRGGGLVAHGHLTMRGTTKPLTVRFQPSYAPMTDGKGNRRAGFTGEVEIDRTDYGVVGGNRFNAGFDPLVSIIDETVRISFGVHGTLAPSRAAPIDSLVAEVERSGVAAVVAGWSAAIPAGDGEDATAARRRAAAIFNGAGYRMMDASRDSDAVELMRVAVLAAPGSARALAGLAEAYARTGNDEAVRENVARALASDPAEVRALVLKAWLGGA